LSSRGYNFEWADICQDLEALQEVVISASGNRLTVRTECKGVCGKVFQAVGVAIPPVIRAADQERRVSHWNSEEGDSVVPHRENASTTS
jgi:hypothetical protein